MNLRQQLGNIDVYLFDQILRGNVPPGASILDAGCGSGRNIVYFLRTGHEVCASDRDPASVGAARELAVSIGRPADSVNFRVEPLEESSFESARFDFVICNAVLHFARDLAHFQAQTDQLRRMLRPGGRCFARLATTISVETVVEPPARGSEPRWHRLPDGTDRFLVDLPFLIAETARLNADLAEPIKTTNVQNLRAMSTWVWQAH